MKELTFKGFLKSYLAELSCCNSSAPTKPCKEVKSNLRLAEPLVLYIKLGYDDNYKTGAGKPTVLTVGGRQQKEVNSQIINELLSELSEYEDMTLHEKFSPMYLHNFKKRKHSYKGCAFFIVFKLVEFDQFKISIPNS